MFKKKILSALALGLMSTGAGAAGLNLGQTTERLTNGLPVIRTLVTSQSVVLPVLGMLPGVNLPAFTPHLNTTFVTRLVGTGMTSITTVVIPLYRPLDQRLPLPVVGTILGGR